MDTLARSKAVRRKCLQAVLLALSPLVPRWARAQGRSRKPQIGVVFNNSPMSEFTGPVPSNPAAKALLEGLRESGWTEAKLLIHWRSAERRYERRRALFEELLRIPVDVLVVGGNIPVHELLKKTRTVPIVSVGMTSPVGVNEGVTGSIARPGGNVTGILLDAGVEIAGKRLALLKQIAPRVTQVALLVPWYASTTPTLHVENAPEMYGAAQALGLGVFTSRLESAARIEAAVDAAVGQGANGLYVGTWGVFGLKENQERIARAAARHRLPTVFAYEGATQSGVLVGYGVDGAAMFRQAARLVDRILKAARPADIPIEQASRFFLEINLRTARELGLAVPPAMLASADLIVD